MYNWERKLMGNKLINYLAQKNIKILTEVISFKGFLKMCVLGIAVVKPILFLAFESAIGFQHIYTHTFLIITMLIVWILAMWKLWDLVDQV